VRWENNAFPTLRRSLQLFRNPFSQRQLNNSPCSVREDDGIQGVERTSEVPLVFKSK